MNVKILECREFCSTTALSSKLRVVKDYEIDVETGKERTVIIDGIEHKIKRGDVCIRKPGQTVYGRGIQNSILLTLDFSGKQSREHYSRNIEGPIQTSISDTLLDMSHKTMKIPMRERCESLNAAAAAAVVLWEMARGQ